MRPEPGRIAAGYQFTCAINDGGVKCWGDNRSGQLGNGTRSETPVPGPVDVSGLASGVSTIAAGGFHACALSSAGGVKCWGSNEYGQLGDGSDGDSSVPVEVSGLRDGVSAISAGWSHTCALTTLGEVRCWGGIASTVSGLQPGVTAIAAGGLHSCALTADGGVTCWGDGQSADPDVPYSDVPVEVPGLASGVAAISATMGKTCALTIDREITCWGGNYAPPPGERAPDRFADIDVSMIAGDVASISVGESRACALSTVGGVSCWGNIWNGELGSASMTGSWVAALIDVPGLGSGVSEIAVGGMHTCALMGTGAVRCWGGNAHHQLGSATRCGSTSIPLDVPLDGAVASPPDPIGSPTGRIEHASGPKDVVLRYDLGPDIGVSELGGEQFNPGPEFTLYGDGTVIYRDQGVPLPPFDAPIVRERPFMIARLDEDPVQALLRYALGEGGLTTACERYETDDTDVSMSQTITVRVAGLVKRVQVGGENPLQPLLDRLRDYDPGTGVATEVWVPDRYWGNLLEPAGAIEIGLLPKPADAGTAPWPWQDIAPSDFVGRDEGGWVGYPRRVLTPAEAGVMGLSDDGGVVQRVYLIGPDDKTLYSFSLWPMHPEEAG